MPLNDSDEYEFSTHLQDEELFDAHYPPGYEIGALKLQRDYGSGSFAEDGRLEVAEDRTMMDGETQMGFRDDDFEGIDRNYLTDVGAAAAADRIASEIGGEFGPDAVGLLEDIGAAAAADRPGSEIGSAAMYGPSEIGSNAGYIAKYGPSEIGAGFSVDDVGNVDEVGLLEDIGNIDEVGFLEDIGAAAAADRPGSEIGSAAMYGPTEIGYGHAPMDGASEIGNANSIEPSLTPFDLFMSEPTRMGNIDEVGNVDEVGDLEGVGFGGFDQEIGFGGFDQSIGNFEEIGFGGFDQEIGAKAIVKVIEKARDNRQPPPPMKAVDIDAPSRDDSDDWALTDTFIGAAAASGHPDPFPLTSQLLMRAGGTTEPRIVRVDTEESYKSFRTANSPELADLAARLEAHIADPDAHSGGEMSSDIDLADDIDDLVLLGAEVQQAEAAKRVELVMPKHYDGLVTAWREGDFVCASLTLPGSDGEVRICTSLEPIRKCVAEMSRHAAEAGVPAATVVGHIPAMGCVLGAGTALKEMAAAAPSILQRPEAAHKAPFMVRVEPKTSPAIAALAMLAMACKLGNQQACEEWQRLGALAPAPIRQAMSEALQIAKAAA